MERIKSGYREGWQKEQMIKAGADTRRMDSRLMNYPAAELRCIKMMNLSDLILSEGERI